MADIENLGANREHVAGEVALLVQFFKKNCYKMFYNTNAKEFLAEDISLAERLKKKVMAFTLS